MKKFISFVAATALVFSLALPVFASESPSAESPSADPVPTEDTTPASNNIGGNTASITESAAHLSSEEEASVHAAAAAIAGNNAFYLDFIDVEAPAGYFNNNSSLRINFVRDYAPNLLGILYWKSSTKSWDYAQFSINDHIISAVFLHTCTVVFVIKAPAVAQSLATDTDAIHGEEENVTATTPASPQTGVTTTVWAVLAVTMAAGAAISICASRKLMRNKD